MTNMQDVMPFTIVFLDEPLPKCFGCASDMTFKDLLNAVCLYPSKKRTLIGKTSNHDQDHVIKLARDKIKEEIKDEIGEAEYARFEGILKDLSLETDYQSLKSSAYIGNSKNARNHMGANNLLEWMFSQDGRIDACFIQKNGMKFIFIIDVRLSNHYNKIDNQLHERNRGIAELISDCFDSKNGNDPTGVFRKGLLDYQREMLKNTHTTAAQFETLLVEIEQLLASTDSVQEKIDSFRRSYSACLSYLDEKEFDKYIQSRLKHGPIKKYQKELFEKLYHYEYGNDLLNSEIDNSFNRIQLITSSSTAFFNKLAELLDGNDVDKSDSEQEQLLLNCFRTFHKMTPSHIDVLDDMLVDHCSEIEDEKLKEKLTYLLPALKRLKTSYSIQDEKTPFSLFKDMILQAKKSSFSQLEEEKRPKKRAVSHNLLADFVNIDMSDISRDANVDKIAHAFIKTLVEEEYQFVSQFAQRNNKSIHHANKNTIYHQVENQEDTFAGLFKSVFEQPNVKEYVLRKYPFLEEYVNKVVVGEPINCFDEFHTICEYYQEYATTGDEDFFVEANNELKNITSKKLSLFQGYLKHVYSKKSESSNVLELIYGSLDVVNQLSLINRLKQQEVNKQKASDLKKNEKKTKSGKEMFEKVFSDFLMDTGNLELQQKLETAALDLTHQDISDLSRMGGEMSAFIKDYRKYSSLKQKPAFSTLVQKIIDRETRERRARFETVLNNYIDATDTQDVLSDLEFAQMELTTDDINHFLSVWEKDGEHKGYNALKMAYLKNCQDSSFHEAQRKLDFSLMQEQSVIVYTYGCMFDNIVENPNEKSVDNLTKFLTDISIKNLNKLLATPNTFNRSEYALLQEVLKIRSKAQKNQQDIVREAVASEANRNLFNNALNKYMAGPLDVLKKESLIDSITKLKKTDVDVFCSVVSEQNIPYNVFFSKLRRLVSKGQKGNFRQDVADLVESTYRRVEFYTYCDEYLDSESNLKQNAEKCLTAYLQLTPQDYKEIEAECEGKTVLHTAILNHLNMVQKDPNTEDSATMLMDVLSQKKWEFDIYFAYDEMTREGMRYIQKGNRFEQIEGETENVFPCYDRYYNLITELEFDKFKELLDNRIVKKPKDMSFIFKLIAFKKSYTAFCNNKSVSENKMHEDNLVGICRTLTSENIRDIYMHVVPDSPLASFLTKLDYYYRDCRSAADKDDACRRVVSSVRKNNWGGQNYLGVDFSRI